MIIAFTLFAILAITLFITFIGFGDYMPFVRDLLVRSCATGVLWLFRSMGWCTANIPALFSRFMGWWGTWGRIVIGLIESALPWKRRRYRRRERRMLRSHLVPHPNGPVHEFVIMEAKKVRYELRCPDPESRVDREVLYCKAAAMIKDLQTKPFAADIRSSDIDHLVGLYVLTALTTSPIEVETVDCALSEENVDNYDKVNASRYTGWFHGALSPYGLCSTIWAYLNEKAYSFPQAST